MAIITNIERLNYYEGEYLGAADFDAEQEYHRDMRRRHNIGQHTYGIVAGLDLAQIPNGGPNGEVDIYLMPGVAVDGFGCEIVALGKLLLTQEPFAPYFDPNVNAVPKQMYLWIAYDQSMVKASQDACTAAGTANSFGRVEESYRIFVTPDATPPPNDPLVVNGANMTPGPSTTPPNPSDIVLPPDGSVPYQEFPSDDQTANWWVPIGRVLWDPHKEIFLPQPVDASAVGRLYAGSVSETIYAPGGELRVANRFPGDVAMEVAGSLHVDKSLQVDGLINGLTQALVGAQLDPTNNTPLSPLTISASGTDEDLIQFRTSAGRETWQICENLAGANPGINIREFVNGNPVDGRLFIRATISGASVPSNVNVGIGSMNPRNALGIRGQGLFEELLSFEDKTGITRWHVNQNPTGTSPTGVPFTRGLNFCETGVADFRFFLQAGGNVGVGTPLPQQNLSVNGSLNIDQANANGGTVNPGLTFGSTSGEGIASKRTVGGNQFGLDFYTDFALRMSISNAGNVGLGVTLPETQLHLAGGVADLTATEGDLKIGNSALRLKMGVALGGAAAGDARIRASGGTSRLMIGSGSNDTLTVQGQRVGINKTNPISALEVSGTVTIDGALHVTGPKTGYVADRFIYNGQDSLEQGDVVVLHPRPSGKSISTGRIPMIEIQLTDRIGDTSVCGIVDEITPGPERSSEIDSKSGAGCKVGLLVTLGAYAFCKVDASDEGVKAGDLLITSSTKGYAAKAGEPERKAGAIIGKALAPLAKGRRGIIPVFVSHQ